jgi:RNA recognition motif-containing protein
MKIFVGGLSYEVTDAALKEMFTPYGTVESAAVVNDRYSGQPRGFGFVEMPVRSEAIAAISALSGTEHLGRTLEVNEARPPAERSGGFRGGSGGPRGRSSGGPRGGGRPGSGGRPGGGRDRDRGGDRRGGGGGRDRY